MLTFVDLLVELRSLMTDAPGNWRKIGALLEAHDGLAEYQVARHMVASAELGRVVEDAINSIDPAERRQAVITIRETFPRGPAGRLLRRVAKDPDLRVRGHAQGAIARLGLEDVALPDTRHEKAQQRWSPAGWSFGLFPEMFRRRRRRVAKPARPTPLQTYGLPELADDVDVAALIGVDVDSLPSLSRPGVEAGSGYVEFEVPKARGGTRRIAAPRAPLRRIQRTLLDRILAKAPAHPSSHGFVPGRSTVTNARPHQGAALVVKCDLKDFFPTVHWRRVAGLFAYLGYSEQVASTLATLTTYRPKLDDGRVLWPGVLPQGAPTSPALANLACRRLDARLAKLAERCGATYTRYADDLTFSFAAPPTVALGRFFWWIDGICQQEGFHERPDKRRVLRPSRQQRITGVVVNQGLHVPRAERQRFRAILHNCKRHGVASQAQGRDDFAAYLAGYAAYVQMVEPELGRRWTAEVAALLGAGGG